MPNINGLPYPALSDPNNPPADFLALATAVDARFPVSIANGGTGAQTVVGAQASLRVGLVPISPANVYKGTSGSASANTLGVISFSGTEYITAGQVFSSTYANYLVNLNITGTSGADNIRMRLSADNTPATANEYIAGSTAGTSGSTAVLFGHATADGAQILIANTGLIGPAVAHINIMNPGVAAYTNWATNFWAANSTVYFGGAGGGIHLNASAYNSLRIAMQGTGTFSGTLQVFGYND